MMKKYNIDFSLNLIGGAKLKKIYKKFTKKEIEYWKKIYKKEFELIEKYLKFDEKTFKIIYKYFLHWGTVENKDYKALSNNKLFFNIFKKINYYELTAQINIYECLFLSILLDSLIKISNKNSIQVLEIGLANGTSAMIINNVLNKYPNKKIKYISVDPVQKNEWSNIGLYNIERIKKDFIKTEHISKYSDKAMNILYERKEKFDLIFIDGGHSYEVVYSDCKYADKLLNIDGLVIHDDVLHYGVKKAINQFYVLENSNLYDRVIIDSNDYNKYLKTNEKMFLPKSKYKSFINPRTMYAFKKIK
jgi:predicted O-methyltransferase YrrM